MSQPINTIAAKIVTLPPQSFPRSLGKIDQLIADAEASATVVASVVASDPLITACCLGRANAASGQEQTRITSAVTVLGLGTVHGLVRSIEALPREAMAAMAAQWSLANACATMCRILGRASPTLRRLQIDDETLHAVGLLNDLGTIAAVLHFPEEWARALDRLESGEGELHDLLKQELGASPGKLGALWGRALNLPQRLVTTIRYHMRPEKADSERELVALAHLARILARACGFTAGRDLFIEPIQPEALTLLGLGHADLDAAIAALFTEMEELELYEGALAMPT